MVFFVIENKRKIIYNEYKIEEEKNEKRRKEKPPNPWCQPGGGVY